MTAIPAAVSPASQRPALAAGLALLGSMRGSGYRSAPALVRRRDGQTLQLTPLLYAVLSAIDGRRDHHAIAAAVSAEVGRPLTAEDTAYLVEEKLRPLGVLRRDDGTDPETRLASPLLALRCKYEVTDPELTARITRPFAALFRPWVVVAVLTAFAAVVVEVLFRRGLGGAIDETFHDPRAMLLVVGLTVLSTGFHEFGHAAACRYGGATPGAMGAGIYLVWPAFYTEVTDSYRLGRGGRLRVDLGGLYFNAVFAVAVFGAWAATGVDALLLIVAAQVLQMVRQLTPLVRFDGYHILADVTGVPDLFHHIKPTLLGLLPTRWGDPAGRVLRPWARAVVTLWVVVVVPVLAVVLGAMVVLLPRLAATAWDGIRVQREGISASLAAGEAAAATVGVLAIVTLAIPVLGIVYLLARVVRRTVRRIWRAAGDHPVRRFGVVTAGLFVATAVAAVWWPHGQYEPVSPTEPGTVQDLLATEVRTAGTGDVEPHRAERAPLRGVPPLLAVDADHDPDTQVEPEGVGGATGTAGAEHDTALAPAPAEPDLDVAAELVDRPDWPFAWDPPPDALASDNRAWAVNTRDGTTVGDVTIDSRWLRDGGPVAHRNEAWALAHCVDCTTFAVAFQALFIVGGADEVTPVNSSVATNDRCERCTTHAVAEQLVLTLDRLPDPQVRARISHVLAQLQALHGTAHRLGPGEVEAVLADASSRITAILFEAGHLVLAGPVTEAAAEESPTVEEPVAEVPDTDVPEDTTPEQDPPEPTPEPATDDAVVEGHAMTSPPDHGPEGIEGSTSPPVEEPTLEPTTTDEAGTDEPPSEVTAAPTSEDGIVTASEDATLSASEDGSDTVSEDGPVTSSEEPVVDGEGTAEEPPGDGSAGTEAGTAT